MELTIPIGGGVLATCYCTAIARVSNARAGTLFVVLFSSYSPKVLNCLGNAIGQVHDAAISYSVMISLRENKDTVSFRMRFSAIS